MSDLNSLKSILFACNHTTYFASHRLPIAEFLVRSGVEVSLFTGSKKHDETIVQNLVKSRGVDLILMKHLSGSKNFFSFLVFLIQFFNVVKKTRPTIVHCISVKLIIVGLICKLFFPKVKFVFAVSGLGQFLSRLERLLRKNDTLFGIFRVCSRGFFLLLRNFRFIVQNTEDSKFLEDALGVPKCFITLVHGSGVDIGEYYANFSNQRPNHVLLASRILVNKGVREYLVAVKELRFLFPDWNFFLAGQIDIDSPSAFNPQELETLLDDSGCIFLGNVDDMHDLLKSVAIFVLPSYREGFPKVLIEAGVAGCSIITTDVVGCRDAVMYGEGGLLIEPASHASVVSAVSLLIRDSSLRIKLAKQMQNYAVENYSLSRVVQAHLDVYRSLL